MLSNDIREFIVQMNTLDSIGCILVADPSLEKLVKNLEEASDIVSRTQTPGRARFLVADRQTKINDVLPPAILVVKEGEYSSDSSFVESVRNKASYFLNAA